jgi:RNA polymerase sigma-70 factor (ECF subfamily)
MKTQQNNSGIDPFTLAYVRKRARQLVGKHGFRESDRDEIEQVILVKLAKRLHKADPDNPKWKAYLATTVSHGIASMIRDKQAEKRDHRRSCSIHTVIGNDEDGPVELSDTIGPREANARLGIAPRSDAALAELGMDVADVMTQLPDDLRELCARLQHSSVSQIARDMGVPRTTVSTAVARLRAYFEEAGMRRHL